MASNKKPKTTGAYALQYAPKKETLFSTTLAEKGARIRVVTNAPPQYALQDAPMQRSRVIIRNRVRAD
jgi:hypothetical protein